jgi:hypothetical protein
MAQRCDSLRLKIECRKKEITENLKKDFDKMLKDTFRKIKFK